MRGSVRPTLLLAFLWKSALAFQTTTWGGLPQPTNRQMSWIRSVSISGSCSAPRVPTTVAISLDDNWDEISKVVEQASTYVQLSSIVKKLDQLKWEASFSEAWFNALQSVAKDTQLYVTGIPLLVKVSAVVLPLISALASVLFTLSMPPEDYRAGIEPYRRGSYDPIQAQAYYSRHKLVVSQRILQLLRLSNRFLISILADKYIFRNEEKMQPKRAKELLELITQLGPTAIKVGQALSVRPDLISSDYATALSSLQDRVPPFDGAAAKAILLKELGREKFSQLDGLGLERNEGPVASASIGQVYKGTIGGKVVAVKVQRPNVLAEIALDLYIVRTLAPIYQRFTGGATDLQALANEWGRGFIAELDYRKEAASTIRFNEEMRKRNLNAVCAPTVVTEYSTEQVLVTEWVDGTRLDQSNTDDVPRLCSVALNAYLVMLLELQSLHCDPHPGNLLRTTDGRLCILDFGMTLDIDPSLQYSLLEYVAHLTAGDYSQLPEDLARLGFLKQDKLEFAQRSGVLEPLKYFLSQAGQGGGAKAVRERIFTEYRTKYPGLTDDELRVEMRAEMKQRMAEIVEKESVATGITMEVEDLQRRNRDSFQIPEWFLYTSRAFLTLEGVSLQADENYSIIKSCFPYVAKRLLADDDPRARKALRDLLYGASDAVDVKRLSDLADGFSSYTTTTKTINQQALSRKGEIVLANGESERVSNEQTRKSKMIEAEATITLLKDAADILLAPQGNLVQNLLIEEAAFATTAIVKETVKRSLVDGPKMFRKALPLGAGALLPPLPFERILTPFVQKSREEIKAEALATKLATIVQQQASYGNGRSSDSDFTSPESITEILKSLQDLEPEQAALVARELRESLPKYAPLLGQLGEKFSATLLRTVSANLEASLESFEATGNGADALVRTAANQLSTFVKQYASNRNDKLGLSDSVKR